MQGPRWNKELLEVENAKLAPYATLSAAPGGTRFYAEGKEHDEAACRTGFQEDLRRIVNSASFRRLGGKTRGIACSTGDRTRTRLTHTLEVVGLSRQVARALALNEALTEAIAFGHDIGHTPFGYPVEAILDEFLKLEGGFRHNEQGLRIIELLEHDSTITDEHGAVIPGLNLTWAVREGIFKHTDLRPTCLHRYQDLHPACPGSLEAQVVKMCDRIAYLCRDLEEAHALGLLPEKPKFSRLGSLKSLIIEVGATGNTGVEGLMDLLVRDLVVGTWERIISISGLHENQVRSMPFLCHFLVNHSVVLELKHQMEQQVYPRLKEKRTMEAVSEAATKLLQALEKGDVQLPCEQPSYYTSTVRQHRHRLSRRSLIADYLAGMTESTFAHLYRTAFPGEHNQFSDLVLNNLDL